MPTLLSLLIKLKHKNRVSDKGLITRIYRELKKLNSHMNNKKKIKENKKKETKLS
jgi:hypothetical protein